jgi:hypothetical protein
MFRLPLMYLQHVALRPIQTLGDQMRTSLLSLAGNCQRLYLQTPAVALGQLIGHGVCWANMLCIGPACCDELPSRMCIFGCEKVFSANEIVSLSFVDGTIAFTVVLLPACRCWLHPAVAYLPCCTWFETTCEPVCELRSFCYCLPLQAGVWDPM